MSDSIENTEQSSKYSRMTLVKKQGTHVTHIYLASKLVTAQPNTFDGETSDLPQIHNNATNCVTPKHAGVTITVLLF